MSRKLQPSSMYFSILALAFLQLSSCSKKQKDGKGGNDGSQYSDGHGGSYHLGGHGGSIHLGGHGGSHYAGGQDGFHYSGGYTSSGHGGSHNSGGHISGGQNGNYDGGHDGGHGGSYFSHPDKANQNSDTFMALQPNEAAFAKAFMKAVKSSDILCKVFDLSGSSGSDYGNFIYNFASYWFKQWGDKNPKIPAAYAARPISQNFYNLPLDLFANAIGYCFGKFLNAVGTLDQSNAQEISDTFIQYLTESAGCTFDGTPHSQFLSIGNGFVNFLNGAVHMNPEKVNKLATYGGDAFLLESIVNGPGDSHWQN